MMCILVAALNDDVHSCIGVGRLCAFLCLSWLTMCIPASALNDYVHSCIGVGRLCAFLFLLWMTICILVSALNDDVHPSLEGRFDYKINCRVSTLRPPIPWLIDLQKLL